MTGWNARPPTQRGGGRRGGLPVRLGVPVWARWSALALLALALALGTPVRSTVELRDLDDGGRLVATLALPDSVFLLRFTHSISGGTVEERYRVVAAPTPQLERGRVWTETGGAAEYYARYGGFRPDGAGWLVETPPLRLERLWLRVDRVGRPELWTGSQRLPLWRLVPDGHLVAVAARPQGRPPLLPADLRGSRDH